VRAAALLACIALAACTAPRESAQPPPSRGATEVLKDALIQSAIRAALVADAGAPRVRVRVERGIATLEGTTADAKSKAAALAAARDTTGVRNVVDRIRVAGP
jgi:osmotically-inducible protein OsmY